MDYYYIFKEDINPEEKLPDNFTLNSRRSRCSSARKIFRNSLEIASLNNIVQSFRLDNDTLNNAKVILEKGGEHTCSDVIEDEHEGENNNMKIGKIAKTLILTFLKEDVISDEEIKSMQDASYSKNTFKLNLPVLKEVDKSLDLDLQKRDQKGYNRYYDLVIDVGGKKYILCSQWVENLHKAAFEKWLELKLMKILIDIVNKLEGGREYIINELLSVYWVFVPHETRKLLGRKFIEKVRNNLIRDVVVLDKKIRNCQVYRKNCSREEN